MKSKLGFWICVSVLGLVEGQPCAYQGCSCYGNDTYCSSLGLLNIPPLVGSEIVDSINFDYNNITRLPAGSLPPNIKSLSMLMNPLTFVEESAFKDCTNTLQFASFSGANFSLFPAAFGRLKSLEQLYVYSSRISDWNAEVMRNLSASVTSFYIEQCGIKTWPDWVRYFGKVAEFSLSDNSISAIPDDGFDNLINSVTSINLQNNSLTSIPRAMSKLLVIQELNLQMNRITDVTWLPASGTLTQLYLSNNKIQDSNQLSRALLPHANTLDDVNIEANLLTSIPNLGFLTNFGFFDVSYNQISDPLSGALPAGITGVNLDFNNLRSIPTCLMAITGLYSIDINSNIITQIRDYEVPPSIQTLNMNFNFITELTDTSFPVNSSLTYLELNNNPIRRISNQAFRNVPKLQFLELRSTKLSRLPLGILSGKGLTGADFTGSYELVCTCEEKDLKHWIVSLPLYSITGNCGRTTVYDFYTTLVTDCPD